MKHIFAHEPFAPGLKPDVMAIGAERENLSRRKARKLAWQYRGGNRAKRYADFLAGRLIGFWVVGKRLVRPPKFSKTTTITTIHSIDAVEFLEKLKTSGQFSFEDPPTFG